MKWIHHQTDLTVMKWIHQTDLTDEVDPPADRFD